MSNITQAVQQQRDSRPNLVQVVQSMQPEIARALPKHMDADRMARLALTALRQTPKLADCTPQSFCGALLTASALGLEPGLNGESYLVPYGKDCQLIIGYQGYVKLFWQHPLAKHIDAQAVYENDQFDYSYGLEPTLTHKPAMSNRGKVIAYYAVASLTTGAKVFTVLSAEEVAALRATSRKQDVRDPMHWMERKTALRQLVKMLPRSTMLQNAMQVDESRGGDLSAHKIPEAISEGAGVTSAIEPVRDSPPAEGDEPEVFEGEVVDDAAAWQRVLDLQLSRGKKPGQIAAEFAAWSGGVAVEDADALAFSQYLDHLRKVGA